jgi:hypothetical protein
MMGWVFFRSPTLPGALGYFQAMFCLGGQCAASVPGELLRLTPWHALWLAIAAALATPLRRLFGGGLSLVDAAPPAAVEARWTRTAGSMTLLTLSAMALAGGTYNAFLYFRF